MEKGAQLCVLAWYSASVARAIDSHTLGDVFRSYGPSVYRRAYRMLGNQADAEEATQEVFIRALRSADTFQGHSQVTTWLYQITTHYCLNLMRDRRRRRELMEEHHVGEERPDAASPSDLVLLRRLLGEADEQQARAAVYVYLDGMTHEEAAELLAVSKRTVGNLLDRFCAWAGERSRDLVGADGRPGAKVASGAAAVPAKRRGS